VGAIALSAGVVTFVGPSAADLSTIAGGADGQSVNVSMPGGSPVTSGPRPTVTLPPTGKAVNASAPSASARGSDAWPFQGRFLEVGALTAGSVTRSFAERTSVPPPTSTSWAGP